VSKQEGKDLGGIERGQVYFKFWQNVNHLWPGGKLIATSDLPAGTRNILWLTTLT
jgi:hypothetical protein